MDFSCWQSNFAMPSRECRTLDKRKLKEFQDFSEIGDFCQGQSAFAIIRRIISSSSEKSIGLVRYASQPAASAS